MCGSKAVHIFVWIAGTKGCSTACCLSTHLLLAVLLLSELPCGLPSHHEQLVCIVCLSQQS